ncbi:MFS transporter [Rhodococcus sp. X156]|uniref:MFS transporter n=1 Tax=Rhodococcus sp. X156 TaxID=2499145 RepID=UPI000FD88DC2|nr:MFS transporter [Rhodococcus sp. X156]
MSESAPPVTGPVAAEEQPQRPLATSVFGLAIVILGAVQLMLVLDGSIVNIALPHLQDDPAIRLSDANLSWVVNGYALAFGGLLLLGGRSGDALGRRRMFIVGIAVFTLASLLGACAWSEWSMIAARVLQGAGAAVASPTALALVSTTFAPGPVRNKAFGVYAAMTGVGSAAGLLLGGVLTDISWRWTFFINVPVGLLVLVLAPRALPTTRPDRSSFDLRGAITATAGFSALVYGFTAGGSGWPWIVAGVVLVAVFVVLEARTENPLVPLRLFTDKDRAVTYLATFITGASLFAMAYFLSRYVQEVLGYSALKTGIAFLPFAVASGLASQLTSALTSRVSPRWIIGPGSVVMAIGFAWASRMPVDAGYVRDLLGPMILIAAGFSLMMIPLTMSAVTRVDTRDAGAASAVVNVVQQMGGAIGLAVLVLVSTRVTDGAGTERVPALAEGFGAAFLTCSGFVLVAGLLSVVGLRTTHHDLE